MRYPWRWILFISALLWLGVVTTILVAWLPIAISGIQSVRGIESRITTVGWEGEERVRTLIVVRVLRHVVEGSYHDREPLVRSALPDWSHGRQRGDGSNWLEVETGWPRTAMRYAWRDTRRPLQFDQRRMVEHGLAIKPLSSRSGRQAPFAALPLRPIWPDFAMNTACMTLGWTGLVIISSILLEVRGSRRRRRGCCLACGHSLRGTSSDVCPECGRDLGIRPPWLGRGRVALSMTAAIIMTAALPAIAVPLHQAVHHPPPAHLAAGLGQADVIASYLAHGGIVDATVDGPGPCFQRALGTTSLHWAAANGHLDVVEQLLAAGAVPDTVDNLSYSAVMHAIDGGHIACVQRLLDAGATLRLETTESRRPLDLAVRRNDLDMARYLLGQPDPLGPRILPAAEPLEMLVTLADGGALHSISLSVLVYLERDEITRTLLEQTPAGRDQTMLNAALQAAVEKSREDIGVLLLDHGARGPLLMGPAIDAGHDRIVARLIKSGVDPIGYTRRPDVDVAGPPQRHEPVVTPEWPHLHAAVLAGQPGIVEVLLDAGVPVELVDTSGRTAMFGLQGLTPDFATSLVGMGFDPSAQDPFGNSPLHVAAFLGDRHAVESLLVAGADPLLPNSLGHTPIDYASRTLPYTEPGRTSAIRPEIAKLLAASVMESLARESTD